MVVAFIVIKTNLEDFPHVNEAASALVSSATMGSCVSKKMGSKDDGGEWTGSEPETIKEDEEVLTFFMCLHVFLN